ncbi:hypothetical protein [Neorhizobium petrolearium]|uniref:Uncharacterized protein n=1 Tax=Neorhizobium petrolearium TaxID=515361 RepID=A0ABY8M273_9HYPH|nr:hypothetical protein [Neorhizobium petrolearium]WGI68076.1 hypothetical protein QEO92_24460 [Neorhizobium petrolearium]
MPTGIDSLEGTAGGDHFGLVNKTQFPIGRVGNSAAFPADPV